MQTMGIRGASMRFSATRSDSTFLLFLIYWEGCGRAYGKIWEKFEVLGEMIFFFFLVSRELVKFSE